MYLGVEKETYMCIRIFEVSKFNQIACLNLFATFWGILSCILYGRYCHTAQQLQWHHRRSIRNILCFYCDCNLIMWIMLLFGVIIAFLKYNNAHFVDTMCYHVGFEQWVISCEQWGMKNILNYTQYYLMTTIFWHN